MRFINDNENSTDMVFDDENTWESWGDYEDENSYVFDDAEDSRLYVTGKIKSAPAPKPISFKIFDKVNNIMKNNNDYIASEEDDVDEYKDVMKNKLNWLSKPTVEIDYDSNYKNIKKSDKSICVSDDDYPSLSSCIFKPKKIVNDIKPEVLCDEKIYDDELVWTASDKNKNKKNKNEDNEQISFEFTKPCATWIDGTRCNRRGCTYAHSEKELKIIECNFKNCNMVIEENKYFLNKNIDRICSKIHMNETTGNFLERLGVKKTKKIPRELIYALSLLPKEKYIEFDGVKYFGEILSTKKEEPKKKEKTQMCRSVKEKTKCPHNNNCRYAHTFDELVVATCGFNEKCRVIQKDDNGYYTNLTNGKVCGYRHPGETKNN